MPYIVKSSLDIGGKVIPWNEQETNKLIKEKTEFLEKKEEAPIELVVEENKEPEVVEESQEKTEVVSKLFKNNKKNQKAGEK